MKSKILLSSMVLVSAVTLTACTHSATQESVETETTPTEVDTMEPNKEMPTTPTENEAMVEDMEDKPEMTDEAVDYSLDLTNYNYAPNVITAEPGETVRVRLTVSEGMHDFVIDELDVQTEVMQVGEETVVEFTVPEDAVGQEYEFYCSVGNHRQLGMVGTLMVQE